MRRQTVSLLALLGALSGCDEKSTQAPAQPTQPAQTAQPAQPAAPKPTTVTVLVTGSASGQLEPVQEGDKRTGGAAELLGHWVKEEKHCAGAVSPEGKAACENASTLALTIGDNWNGPAISSFFYGESTATVMGRMGFAASALGNHELDFGKDQFLKNRGLGGFPFLAANLKVADESVAKDWAQPAFKVFERQGLKVGVVGLTSNKTVSTAMTGRAQGLEVVDYEVALSSAVPAAWKEGADTVVVVGDVCPADLQPVVARHPEWKLSLVAGGRCPQPVDTKEGNTTFVSLGRGFDKYLRAQYTFDASKPEGEQVTAVETKVVELPAGAAPDAEAAKLIAAWKEKTDTILGEEIGFTQKGMTKGSDEMVRWVGGAAQEVLKADGVILNRNGFRNDVPAGKVTRGSVYSVLPYENTLLLVEMAGADLAKQLDNPQAAYVGFKAAGKGKYKDAKGKALDAKKTYTVATVEYLYFGGDGFEFEKLDPEPGETGMSWQTPVIDWTKKQATSDKKPLEKALR
jgi:2',3'-cyclic-nucleotide 2'-phosphodiesterase (5'-nucleotidase family)